MPPFRFNVEALVGAEETDVDTGDTVSPGRSVDLSVVSAYLKSSQEDIEASPSSAVPAEHSFKVAPLGRTASVLSAIDGWSWAGTHVPSADLGGAASLSDVSLNHSDSCSLVCATIEEVDKLEEEEDQEFYI